MSRRDRIRARLIYRAWGFYRQMRWIPPHGWVTKMQALGLGYSSGAQSFRDACASGPDLIDAVAYMVQSQSRLHRPRREPNIQFIKPPLTDDAQKMVDDIRAIMIDRLGLPK